MDMRRSIAWIVAGLGLGAGSSCSLVLDFPQCVTDIDCTNAEGVELVCRNEECVVPMLPSSVACNADTDCIAELGDGVTCGAGGVCAALTTDLCELRVEPEGVAPDDIVYIGSILPRTGTYAAFGVPLENAVQLAVEDFNNTATLPGGKRIGWMACDSRGRAADAAEAAQDLVDAGIQTIVGPGLSEETVAVAEVTAAAGSFLISPTASARVLGQLVDNGLVWRTAGNDSVQVAGIADRIAQLDPPPQRVVALVKNDLYGNGMLEELVPRLEGVLPTNGLGTLLYSPLDAFPDAESLLSEYGARVAATFELDPEVIVVLGSVEARELVLFYLDAWASSDPRPALPTFLLSSEAVPVAESIVEGVSESFRVTLMDKMEGVTHTSREPDDYGPFAIRYEIRFPNEEAGLNAGLAYDATMVGLLAHSALPGGEGSGTEIAQSIARLADEAGTQVSFGEGLSFITTVQEALAAGGSVDLRGMSGELDFDLESGNLRRELTGFDVEPISGSTQPKLTARRRYELDPAPAVTGTWVDL